MSSLTLSKEEEKRLKGLGFLNNKGTDNFKWKGYCCSAQGNGGCCGEVW